MTWNADNPGVCPGSLLFLEAESWACQVAGNADPAAGNVFKATVGEGQVTEKV